MADDEDEEIEDEVEEDEMGEIEDEDIFVFTSLRVESWKESSSKPWRKFSSQGSPKRHLLGKEPATPTGMRTMIFNFKEHPDLMMDKVVEIRVFNTRKLLKDAVIGSFKFDVGLAYNEPDHCFIHKWLLLTNPEDSSSSAKGYVKVSINVIGPGDEPKHSPATMSPDKGMDLQPSDPGGKLDPYIKLKIGKTEINDKENYIPNQLNPMFGKVFEIPALIPLDHTLQVTVMDWDLTSADDLIGTTTIDLENRLISQHRATCGLSGSNFKMRKDPFCRPWFREGAYSTLCPSVPGAGAGARARETRTLYNPAQPGISQGSLHMWVDIFPRQGRIIPPPVNITPRKPEKFFLRIVVWNTVDVELNETSAITGEDMSDIYVKGWLQGQDKTQKTDVHYRSLDGEGNFNWRFVFEFDYLPSEHVMVIKKKEHFYSLDKTESFLPPRITMQVWDNDLISADDFIGTIDMDLHEMPRPSAAGSSCTLELLCEFNAKAETVNLFEQKTIKGFWPVYSNRKEGRELTGKLELEMELVTAEEHEQRPAGKARDEPNTNPVLSPPNRPATSFFWFSSPLKTLRFVVWKQFKWPIIIGTVLVLIAIAVAIFVYTAPGYIMNFIAENLIPSI
ncbi:hypothetical protein EMCRGX_G027237 [Ephydatia muelleri]